MSVAAPVPRSLAAWLDWQQRQHPASIALGLERVAAVSSRLGIEPGRARVISVAGTNGKGTCAAAAEALALAAGHSVGCYSSPHLQRYNERVRIHGEEVSDAALCEAFSAVEAARSDTPLTYFEYGTLAALWLFARAKLDLWVLEVGLGGRLDAVNIIAADVAVVTSIGLDHQAWLGDSLDAIGREKAGIARRQRPLLVGIETPPDGLLKAAAETGAQLQHKGREFVIRSAGAGHWRLASAQGRWEFGLPAGLVPDNPALAILALAELGWPPTAAQARSALADLQLPGRCERVVSGRQETLFDVAHNLPAAEHLAAKLAARGAERWTAVYSALVDKPIEQMTECLAPHIDCWHLAPLNDPRGLSTAALAARLPAGVRSLSCASVAAAMDATRDCPRRLVWGSFLTVAAAKEAVHG